MKKKIYIISLTILLALIYLLSGIAKAADINAFADVIVLYGFPKLYFLAPIINFIEIVMAFMLLLFWNTRKVALFSFYFILVLTFVFAYGLVFMGISDCGCFGSFYQTPVWVSIVRNTFMLGASYWLYKNAVSFKIRKYELFKPIISIMFGITTLYFTITDMKTTYYPIAYTQGDSIKNTFLETFEQKNGISRLIFIFSPRCGHCINTTPAVNNLLKNKEYDDVIGLYPKEIPDEYLQQYIHETKPLFEMKPIPYDSIRKVTRGFPVFIKLKDGKIEKVMKEI